MSQDHSKLNGRKKVYRTTIIGASLSLSLSLCLYTTSGYYPRHDPVNVYDGDTRAFNKYLEEGCERLDVDQQFADP